VQIICKMLMSKTRLKYVCQRSKQHYPVGWCGDMF